MPLPDKHPPRIPLLGAINSYYRTVRELRSLVGKPKSARRRHRLTHRADRIIEHHFHKDGGFNLARLIRLKLRREKRLGRR